MLAGAAVVGADVAGPVDAAADAKGELDGVGDPQAAASSATIASQAMADAVRRAAPAWDMGRIVAWRPLADGSTGADIAFLIGWRLVPESGTS
jgi:hypothetical protein